MTLIFLLISAYILGSIPSAVWYGKIFHNIDVREHGSKSAGATNTLRILGNKAGFVVLFFDFLKGFAAANLIYFYKELGDSTSEILTYKMLFGVLAVVGHIYPVFANFKGGKGVATLLGLIVALDYRLALICLVVFILVVWITKYISLGSMTGGIISPFVAGFLYEWNEPVLIGFCIVFAVMLIYTHRTNIKRLIEGNENKFAFKKKEKSL